MFSNQLFFCNVNKSMGVRFWLHEPRAEILVAGVG